MSNNVLVIGAQNIDIFTKTKDELKLHDSNIVKIDLAFGGVGRNIVYNLKLLGLDTHFLTVFGDDQFSKLAFDKLEELQINTINSLHTNGSNSIYMGILDDKNDLFLGLNDMDIINKLNPNYLAKHIDYINTFSHVVIDNNLSQPALNYLLKNIKGVKIVDAVSTKKLPKLFNLIPFIDYLKVNHFEYLDLKENQKHSDYNIKNLIITNGEKEITLINENKTTINPIKATDIVNATGAGDGFIAGFTYGIINEMSDYEALNIARKVAYLTLKHNDAVNPHLSLKGIEEIE